MNCYTEFTVSYLKNLILFSIRVKELFGRIVSLKRQRGFAFYKSIFLRNWTLNNARWFYRKTRKIKQGNLNLIADWSSIPSYKQMVAVFFHNAVYFTFVSFLSGDSLRQHHYSPEYKDIYTIDCLMAYRNHCFYFLQNITKKPQVILFIQLSCYILFLKNRCFINNYWYK